MAIRLTGQAGPKFDSIPFALFLLFFFLAERSNIYDKRVVSHPNESQLHLSSSHVSPGYAGHLSQISLRTSGHEDCRLLLALDNQSVFRVVTVCIRVGRKWLWTSALATKTRCFRSRRVTITTRVHPWMYTFARDLFRVSKTFSLVFFPSAVLCFAIPVFRLVGAKARRNRFERCERRTRGASQDDSR